MKRTYRSFTGLNRRTLLKAAIGSGLGVSGLKLLGADPIYAQIKAFPFSLGVASGEPAPDGFVIWTRLAPEPLTPSGGMPSVPFEVTWEVAADEAMQRMVRSGRISARPEVAHSVHVAVEGLEPCRDYFYRFRSNTAESAIGRVRTLPAHGSALSSFRFASAGCQRWEHGFFTAWRRIAEEDFDFVFNYGDYIYEYPHRLTDGNNRPYPRVMPKDFGACVTLSDYRRRYALYKSDPDLQAAHSSCAFISSFDDHEVIDDWAADSTRKNTPAAFLSRRAAAFQAWYEHMPVRRGMVPRGSNILAYRKFSFGNLADIAVLDTRQYRSKHACGDKFYDNCREAGQSHRTILGADQESWLAKTLHSNKATWQVLAQQVPFSRLNWQPFLRAEDPENKSADLRRIDGWDGAEAGRNRVLAAAESAKAKNLIVLSGDAHKGLAIEIKKDWLDQTSECLGAEFIATSISSDGNGSRTVRNADDTFAKNPHLKFVSNERGYTRHVVNAKQWQADFRVVERISTPDAPVLTRKSFVVNVGRPGLSAI